jgi:REP element-mobilizing transposase RayT
MARHVRQLDLGLREPARWGGRREGAGRKRGPNPRDPHRARASLETQFPSHVTLKVRRGLPSLRAARLVRELERSFAAACERGRFRLVQYSLQNDHLHAIVEATSQRDLASGMMSIGSRLARAVNRVFRRRGPVLADRYHLHVLRTPREVRNALAYCLLNARRHLAKMRRRAMPRAVIDPASSGFWFTGWKTCQTMPRAQSPPVAPPRTWLLRIGWRRHGLLDPSEIPGSDS